MSHLGWQVEWSASIPTKLLQHRRFQNLDYSSSFFCSDAGDLTPVLWLLLDQAISYNTVECKTLRCAISCDIRAHLHDQHSAKIWNVSLTPESSLCSVLLIGNTFLVDWTQKDPGPGPGWAMDLGSGSNFPNIGCPSMERRLGLLREAVSW